MKYLLILSQSIVLVAMLAACGGDGTNSESAKWIFKRHPKPVLVLEGLEYSSDVANNIVVDINDDGFLDVVTNGNVFLNPFFDGSDDAPGPSGFEIELQVLVNQGDGTFENKPDLMFGDSGAVPAQISPGDIASGDLNGDLKPDFVLFDQGYDVEPFPGGFIQLILSTESEWEEASEQLDWPKIGFYHGGSIGDINGDTFIDVIATDLNAFSDLDGSRLVPLLNDGSGNFSHSPEMIPEQWRNHLVDLGRGVGLGNG